MGVISLYYQNTRGLRTKVSKFFRAVCLNDYDVVCITESWLTDGISDSELFDSRYLVYRRDRNYSQTGQIYGGGVLLGVKRELNVVERADWSSAAEDYWITLTLNKKQPTTTCRVHICVVYLCKEKGGNSYKTQLQLFSNKLNQLIISHPVDKFIIMGDFNFGDEVLWDRSTDTGDLFPASYSGEHLVEFFDVMNTCNLTQYNAVCNINNRLLDLVFSNDPVVVRSCDDPLVPEDVHHKSLHVTTQCLENDKLQDNIKTSYNFKCGDYESINSLLLNVDWCKHISTGSLNDAVTYFYSQLYDCIEKHVPVCTPKSSRYPLWYSSALKKILKEKFKFHRKFKTYGNLADYHSFCLLRTRAAQLEEKCYETYIGNVESSIKENPKYFWTYVKRKLKCNALPSIMKLNDVTADTGRDISSLFASYFGSTYLDSSTAQLDSNVNATSHVTAPAAIGSVEIDEREVLKLLSHLDLTKGAGPDKIPPYFIVQCADSLYLPLSIIFRRSLAEGVFPDEWKSAFVTPVHKGGDKTDVQNYRPISKLCLFAKILEKIIHKQLYSALKCSFTDEQHGFLKNKSTTSNLIIANEFITAGMDGGSQVDVIYTDYRKCFDRIDHKVLLSKLYAAGIHGDLFRWFASYIRRRSQAVVVQGFSSHWVSIPSGVPQGSILGPLLFVIFILDIAQCFKNSKILLFADDMKILKVISTLRDVHNLQEDLLRFQSYCNLNKLDLNVNKCFYVTFSRKQTILDEGYNLLNTRLKKADDVKDLGVIHDGKLVFDKHIDNIVRKASKALGFIMRTSVDFRSIKTVKILYCAYVRSHLEYASQVWNPQYSTYINRIESIQKRFLRFLDYKARVYSSDYEHRCVRYHFLPLVTRRSIADVCYLAQIATGVIDSPELLSKISLNTNMLRFRSRPILHVPFANTNYRQNTFLIRSCNSFSKLPIDIDLFFTSIASIKKLMTRSHFGILEPR